MIKNIKDTGAGSQPVGPLAITKALVESAMNKTEITIGDEGGTDTNITVTKQNLEDLQKDLLNFRDKHEKEDLQHFRAELEGPSAALKLGQFSPLDMNIMRTYLDNNVKNVS
ncbi:MAG: hypothetical protein ACUZ8E_10215 [Candidatus Anammoxibacter sp.]